MNFLEVIAYMRSSVICDNFLPLDGILYYYAAQQKYGFQDMTLPGENPKIDIKLPLKIINFGSDNWYYSCSWAYPLGAWWIEEGKQNWTKSFDLQYSDLVQFRGRGTVAHKGGKYKSYNMPVFYKIVDKITWYAVGNKEEIEKILRTAFYIGKKSSQGWGRVSEWKVNEINNDWSIEKDGCYTRGIPYDNRLEGQIINYGYRPSYWEKENQGWIKIK